METNIFISGETLSLHLMEDICELFFSLGMFLYTHANVFLKTRNISVEIGAKYLQSVNWMGWGEAESLAEKAAGLTYCSR